MNDDILRQFAKNLEKRRQEEEAAGQRGGPEFCEACWPKHEAEHDGD